MVLLLRPGLFFCESDGHIIFLDLMTDRYFRLSADAEILFRSFISGQNPAGTCGAFHTGQSHEPPSPLLSDLFAKSGAGQAATTSSIAIPRRSLMDMPYERYPPGLLLRVIVDQIIARVRLKFPLRKSIERIASRRTASRSCNRTAGTGQILQIGAAYLASRALISHHDHCLFKSLALATRLAAIGAPFALVIGVRPRPFAAHCWVQHHDLVLNDSVEHVRSFTPIFAT